MLLFEIKVLFFIFLILSVGFFSILIFSSKLISSILITSFSFSFSFSFLWLTFDFLFFPFFPAFFWITSLFSLLLALISIPSLFSFISSIPSSLISRLTLFLFLSFFGGLESFFCWFCCSCFSRSIFFFLRINLTVPHKLNFFFCFPFLFFLFLLFLARPTPIFLPMSLFIMAAPNLNKSFNLFCIGLVPEKQKIKKHINCIISTIIQIIPP